MNRLGRADGINWLLTVVQRGKNPFSLAGAASSPYSEGRCPKLKSCRATVRSITAYLLLVVPPASWFGCPNIKQRITSRRRAGERVACPESGATRPPSLRVTNRNESNQDPDVRGFPVRAKMDAGEGIE